MILDQIKITIWSITKKWSPIRSWSQITRSSDHSIFWIHGSESHMKFLKNLLNTLSILIPLVIFFSLAIFKKNLKFAKNHCEFFQISTNFSLEVGKIVIWNFRSLSDQDHKKRADSIMQIPTNSNKFQQIPTNSNKF